MKKILIIIVFFASSIAAFSQGGKIERDVLKAYKELIADSTLEINGELFNWGIDDKIPVDGDVMVRIAGIWTNGNATGTDSTTFDITNGYAYRWFGGVKIDSTLWDDRYLLLEDTVDYVQYVDSLDVFITPPQLSDSLDEVRSRISGLSETITLPYSSSVFGRISSAVEGVDYPEGWILTADGLNLVVTHNVGRGVANVTVKGRFIGDIKRQLKNTNAYDYFQDNNINEIKIFSLSKHLDILYVTLYFE